MAAPGPPDGLAAGTSFAQGTGTSLGPTAPATVDANDILVVLGMSHQPVSVGTISWPSGYTEGQQVDIKDSSGTVIGRAGWAWKRAAGTEDGAAQTITRTGDSGTDSAFQGGCFRIAGCATSGNPFDTPPTPVAPNATTTVDWPSVTTSSAEVCLILVHLIGGLNSNVSTPTNYTAHASRGGTSGTDGAMDVDYRQVTSTGTYDPANGTQTTDADTAHAQFQIPFKAPPSDIIKDITAAVETDTAQALTFTKAAISKDITAAVETDQAQALSFTQQAIQMAITAAVETDVAQTLTFTQGASDIFVNISPATESDIAQALAFTQQAIQVNLTSATETDAAQALGFTLGPAISKDITAATEIDSAQTLSVLVQPILVNINPATELDVAQALSFTGGAEPVIALIRKWYISRPGIY